MGGNFQIFLFNAHQNKYLETIMSSPSLLVVLKVLALWLHKNALRSLPLIVLSSLQCKVLNFTSARIRLVKVDISINHC